ncbi:hypothetical protein [Granulicoccus phenolivorans]|uniref:hypothetical protein n=1 Tax=Granulicoccus phenolivorans TaxID=266854 RepID=UPI00041631CC|nr:hypothetical protein [Granulicoccus phenolivorans]
MSGVRASALGSWPGTDFAATQRMVLGELTELPHLVELPARGVGAQLIGRATAMVTEIGLDLQPAGWRLAGSPGIDQSRARALWRNDLDRLEELAQGYAGAFTVAVAGPWTMAALVEKPRGDKVLADPGARRELGQALADGVAAQLRELRRRLPGLALRLQLDEPLLPQVASGAIRTASGLHRHRGIDRAELSAAWTAFGEQLTRHGAGEVPITLHCCGAGLPWEAVEQAPLTGLSVPAYLQRSADWDHLAGWLDRGRELWLGVLRTDRANPPEPAVRPIVAAALAGVRPLELGPTVTERLVLTPDCGLAGWPMPRAIAAVRALTRACDEVTDRLTES